MTRHLQKIVAIALVLVLVFSITGCGHKLDAAGYVQAELDLLTKGDVEQYAKEMKISKKEAQETYEDVIDDMDIAETLLGSDDLTEDIERGFNEWIVNLLSKAKYTVMESQEVEDGYVVIVAVEPIKAFEGMQSAFEAKTQDYMAKALEKTTAGEEVTEEQITKDMYGLMLETLNEMLGNITYGEKVEVETKIIREADGEYEIDEKTFEELGATLIDYTDSQTSVAE